MTNQQEAPNALQLAERISDVPCTSEEDAKAIAAAADELVRLHSENETLQAGYTAARLEIESLQARIKAMAEEHADELMVAHMDGRMRGRSTEPAGEYPALPEPDRVMEDWSIGGVLVDYFTTDQMRAFADATHALRASHGQAPAQAAPAAVAGPTRDLNPEKCPITGRPYFMTLDHPELGPVPTYGGPFDSYTIPAPEGEPTDPWHERELRSERYDHDAGWWVEGGEPIPLRIVHEDVLFKLQEHAGADTPTTQPAPQQEAQEPAAVVVPCHTPSGKRVALYSAKQDLPIGTQLYTAPQPSPAAQGDALPREDFAWLVVQEACETEPADEDDPECVRILRRDLKSSVLAAFLRLDAARAAQEGKSCPKE